MCEKTFTIHEYGKATHNVLSGLALDEHVTKNIDKDIEKFTEFTKYLSDWHWDKKPHHVKSTINALGVETIGWYARGGSVGYDVLKEHFRKVFSCSKEHVPAIITEEFLLDIMKKWKAQRDAKDYTYY